MCIMCEYTVHMECLNLPKKINDLCGLFFAAAKTWNTELTTFQIILAITFQFGFLGERGQKAFTYFVYIIV